MLWNEPRITFVTKFILIRADIIREVKNVKWSYNQSNNIPSEFNLHEVLLISFHIFSPAVLFSKLQMYLFANLYHQTRRTVQRLCEQCQVKEKEKPVEKWKKTK